MYNPAFLTWVKDKIPNSYLAILFVNSMKYRTFTDMNYFHRYFDKCYTIDYRDAQSCGMEYLCGVHSFIPQEDSSSEILYDLTFAGADKGRGKLLADIYRKLTNDGIRFDCTVINMKDAPDGVNTRKLTYKQTLLRAMQSKTILEISVEEQHSMTLRALEAIMYNKKLITNNPTVMQSRYYNPDYIKVIKDIDEIDPQWIRQDVDVDYHYQGDFSPFRILEDMEQTLSNTNFCK